MQAWGRDHATPQLLFPGVSLRVSVMSDMLGLDTWGVVPDFSNSRHVYLYLVH